jgi:hypothetical protein
MSRFLNDLAQQMVQTEGRTRFQNIGRESKPSGMQQLQVEFKYLVAKMAVNSERKARKLSRSTSCLRQDYNMANRV